MEVRSSKTQTAKLIIETPKQKTEPVLSVVEEEANPTPQTPNPKLTALNKIRSQYKTNGNGDKSIAATPLEMESLQKAWNEFAQMLKDQKNAAGQNFEMAELHIVDANNFYAKTTNSIQFKFVENNGLKVTDYLKEKLNNQFIRFFVVMEEKKQYDPVSAGAPLTAKEQFQKMAEQFPLVKELKERLGLELDY